MRADVTCEMRSLTFSSSARARSGFRISQFVSFFSSSISPAGVFNTTRRTCVLLKSVSFLSRNSSGFLSISFFTDWAVRNVSFEFWNRTYILPSISIFAEQNFRRPITPEQFEFELWIVQAVLSELALVGVNLFGWDGSLLLPVLQVRQQTI